MKEIFSNILKSFNNADEGYSSRKLTAFIIIVMVVIAHIKWLSFGDFTHLEMVLTIDYSFIAALFGMTTYTSIKTQNSNKTDKTKEK
jgi:hypothetical protein